MVGTLAIGQTLIILTAGIDLSNGAIMAFGTIVMTRLRRARRHAARSWRSSSGSPCARAFGVAQRAAGDLGRLPPFIVTLGMLNIAFALTHIYSKEQTITGLPGALTALGQDVHASAAPTSRTGRCVMIGDVPARLAYVLRQTAWGRHVYAVGNNPEAARLTGIPVKRLLITVYTVAGVVYGIAGAAARSPVPASATRRPARPTTSTASPRSCSAAPACSAGGARVIGTLIGALIVGVIRNGLQLMRRRRPSTRC